MLEKDQVLVVGNGEMAFSIASCLVAAGNYVTLQTTDPEQASHATERHFSEMGKQRGKKPDTGRLNIIDQPGDVSDIPLAIVITAESLGIKKTTIAQLESVLSETALIAINVESFALSELQEDSVAPGRIIGANWVAPAHTTYFLEVISNHMTDEALVNRFLSAARLLWQKDPYHISTGFGIRARMMCAMVREAFYLLENGYVSIEDIDRACRNDPGYYLPFAGHCRYMELMGTFIYGMVMKDLNPELSKATHVPAFFTDLVRQGHEGMDCGKGFYDYDGDEVERRKNEYRKFSYEIQEIIARYPFGYTHQRSPGKLKITYGL